MSSLYKIIHYWHVFLICVCSVWLTLCDPMDCSLPGSSAQRILQARILECVAITSSRGILPPKDQTPISFVSCIGKQVLYHWATCFPMSADLNIWVISTGSFHWSFFFFLLSVGQVFLFLPTSNNLGLYPRYCKWRVLETLDSVLFFQRKILF